MAKKAEQDSREVVLSAHDIRKDFHLPHEKSNSLKGAVVNIFKKKDKDIDTQHALRGVSFDIRKGEFFGILGRNGSGKSTLLKILAEIYQPTRGEVKVKGKLVPFIELGVGFNPELTGRENVYLNGALLGFSEKEIDEKYDEIVEFAELEDFMEQKLKNYSSGMQVRLAFSVATRAEADILLVDEVLAVGDADFQRKCYKYFKSLKSSGKTVIFVTHDMGAVKEYCDRAILIDTGKIIHSGRASKIADEYLKLFNKTKELSKGDTKPDRWGSGDILIKELKHSLTKDRLNIKLEIQNQTANDYIDAVDLGLDLLVGDQLVSGTHYLYYHTRGFSMGANQSRMVELEFDNDFGGHDYKVNLNIKTDGGTNVCDHWDNALSFTNNYEQDRYFKVILRPSRFDVI